MTRIIKLPKLIALRLTLEQYRKILSKSRKRGITVSEYIRGLIDGE